MSDTTEELIKELESEIGEPWPTIDGRPAKPSELADFYVKMVMTADKRKSDAREAVLVKSLQIAISRFRLIQADGTTPRERQIIASLGEKEALATISEE